MGAFSIWHLLILLIIVLVVFGAGKLPEVGKALGTAIHQFKTSVSEGEEKAAAKPDDEPKA
ncbi:MAG TPA: twin-arginine translocase TatA/TatE family subunit [Candidatus Hydrogenedentes bacterium]|nr:twin-arginine translocase TatA/TatE family subunit [Candidatus Hydrogenedentota bacterium]HOS02968.1 twin-arginine translocase TatA/TatE family subunit [Candidatus Hydrogenedentota bacterium]